MLKIRLSRTGKKKQPSFRVVVQEHTAPIKGKFVEEIGYYRPADDPKVFKINLERAKYWLSVGARPSDSIAVLLKKEGVQGLEKFIEPRDKKRNKKKEEAKEPVKEAPKEEAKAEEAPKEEPKAEEAPKEEAPKEEAPKEEAKTEEPPAGEAPKEEAPKEEPKTEDIPPEEPKES